MPVACDHFQPPLYLCIYRMKCFGQDSLSQTPLTGVNNAGTNVGKGSTALPPHLPQQS